MPSIEAPHPFAETIRILGRGKKGSRSLTFDESRAAMTLIAEGQVEPMQLGAFLMLLRVKEESPEELAGFLYALKSSTKAPTAELAVDLDWSSYAGKRQHHPWFLLAALALADSGVRVLLHGGAGHTPGRLYTATAIEQLGIPACEHWGDVQLALDESQFAFIAIEQFCPTLAELLQLKPLLGLRSCANSLARLLNPAAAPTSLHSIFHPSYAPVHQQTLGLLEQKNIAVFKGEGGEIERKPDANCEVLSLRDGLPCHQRWPRMLEDRQQKPDQPDARALIPLWRGERADAYGEAAVIGTLAIALAQLEPFTDTEEATERAHQLWQARNRNRL